MWLVWWNFPNTKIHLWLWVIWKMWLVWCGNHTFPTSNGYSYLFLLVLNTVKTIQMSDHDWQSAPTNSDFHTGCTSIPSQNHPGNIKGGLIVAQWEHNGGAHWSNCRPFPPYSWNSPWTCSGKHENVAIPNDSHMNWLQLRLMTKSVTSLMKFPKKRNTLMIKSVTSLMKFPKDRNTLTNEKCQ